MRSRDVNKPVSIGNEVRGGDRNNLSAALPDTGAPEFWYQSGWLLDDQFEARKLCPDYFGRAVGRIVDDDDFRIGGFTLAGQR